MGLMLLPLTAMAKQTILVFGDSLSAAYGIPREAGWVSLLEKKLAQEKPDYEVVNASISGETTSGGVRRIDALLIKHKPAIVILELGANDGLRGLPLSETETNLSSIITANKKAGARTLLIGMRLPPNYGIQYTKDFANIYVGLAKKTKAGLVSFLLQDVAGKPELTQPDGLHPVAQAQGKLLENVWVELKPMLH
ncbi:acyl-CoA thioesterase I [Novimethylophilus kurashikiensis]|uniref:Acyl-CoA thioesterase I n=2 Tax=Novimethylophilus kurashikiensis TaxID=1825523 RepID=A0A2R5FJF5_9PROT|nr:acyl-CoA thioesterase I [Novimethylophilus kurashikiensis]